MYKNFEIIDAHTHVFPDNLAERAMRHLSEAGGITPEYNGTITGLINNMEHSYIDKSVALSIATKPEQVSKINNWVIEMQKKYSDKIIFSGSLHPDFKDVEKQVKKLKKNNINVIKMHPEYQKFFPDEKRMLNIYKVLVDYDMIIFFHTGYDIAFAETRSYPENIIEVINKYPKLTVVAAHLGSYKLWDKVLEYLAGSNIWLDTGFIFEDISKSIFLKILEKHGADKILFATDVPWKSQKQYVEHLYKNYNLDLGTLNKIYSENAKKLFSIR
jgi:hypothetical protein